MYHLVILATEPILVALRGDRPILDAICAEFRRWTKERIKPEEIDELLLKGRLLLLLDGLNEIPSQEREQQINQFRQDNPHTPMIFTSREMGTGLGIEQRLEMCGLTEWQMRSFVQNYLPDYAEVLLCQLKNRLQGLAETPLLLKLLCDVFDLVTQQIPRSKGELFRTVDAKYNDWKQREGVRTAEKFWQWNGEILGYLAFVMLQADSTPTGKWLQIERTHAEHLLEQFLQNRVTAPGEKAKDWLQDLLDHHLLQLAANPNQIEFHHQLFQEYYAAEYLLQQLPNLSDTQLKRDYLNLLKWTDSFAITLSLENNKALIVAAVEQSLTVDLMLGSRLAGEVNQNFQAVTIELIKNLDLPLLLKLQCWARSNSTIAVPELIGILNSEWNDYSVRASAAKILGQIGSEIAVPDLLNFLEELSLESGRLLEEYEISLSYRRDFVDKLHWECIEARKSVIEALEQIGNEVVVPGLLSALYDWNAPIRKRAAKALGQLGIESAIPELLNAIHDDDVGVQVAATEALRQIKSETSTFRVSNLSFEEKPHEHMPSNTLEQQVNEEKINNLFSALDNQDHNICWGAIDELVQIGNEKVIPGLLYILEHKAVRFHWKVFDALRNIGVSKLLPNLRQLQLKDSESYSEDELNRLQEAIASIQKRCQFYNYEIFQFSPEPTQPTVIDLHTKIDKIDQRTKQMAEQPNISIGTISGVLSQE